MNAEELLGLLYAERAQMMRRVELLDQNIKATRRRIKRARVEATECGCADWQHHYELS